MKLWEKAVCGYVGGMSYVALELLWRGWSHGSMFLVGGLCFLVLIPLGRLRLPLLTRAVIGACAVTGVELVSGLVVNRILGLNVWDYSGMPYNFMGQICISYFFLWIWVSMLSFGLDRGIRRLFSFS